MTDITIPADVAKQIANVLRGIRIAYPERCDEWADLLDQPAPSLRDEVVKAMQNILGYADEHGLAPMAAEDATDGLLAVVRRHIEGMSSRYWVSDSPMLRRDDVLRLLGGDE